ncbi:uncharacterized protein DEA37_0000150 [Paragonimus westermani]|uniref:Cytochrome b/b6 N-terminal region profile domain-containing protein n=1 Tax=Paragonimus westermani TaxID=34504 RepID=A0A5J4NET3_9TREM|nr:uncharacterized protein DEA37_0000150 [Paragonimus westermani]
MVEAFLGCILPWHQISYRAATVLTSVLNRVLVVGRRNFAFIAGGFGVTNAMLVRVFYEHICL